MEGRFFGIVGHKTRGSEVISLIESFGFENVHGYDGTLEDVAYTVDNNKICTTDLKVATITYGLRYTLEVKDFEKADLILFKLPSVNCVVLCDFPLNTQQLVAVAVYFAISVASSTLPKAKQFLKVALCESCTTAKEFFLSFPPDAFPVE